MATRTAGPGAGWITFVVIVIVLMFVFLILAIVGSANTQKAQRELADAQADLREAIPPDQRTDRWEELKSRAGRGGVVLYLDEQLGVLKQRIGGSPRDTPEDVATRIDERLGEGSVLLRSIDDLESRLSSVEQERDSVARARDAARADLQALTDRQARVNEEQQETIAALRRRIGELSGDVSSFRVGVEDAKSSYLGQLSETRAEFDQQVAELEERNRELADRNLVLSEQVRRLQGEAAESTLRPQDEASLIDGRVVGVNPAAREVYLSLGRGDRVVLGMTFEVYSADTVIRPNAEGEFPPGKATLEVIRIDPTTSVSRVIRGRAGNPVAENDALVNAIYDPQKTYVFTVEGNFDTNGDGVATPGESADIRAFIEEWGGVTEPELSGRTDFLVMGERPVLPPEPRQDDPIEVIQRYLTLSRAARGYDETFDEAVRASIPVLNQNRFYTLTGLAARP